jgi:RHS repeat-associated protein
LFSDTTFSIINRIAELIYVQTVTDPRGIATQTTYDMLGQVLESIARLIPEIEGSTPSSRMFNSQNQTSTVSGGTAPTYDNNGNTISDNGQTFVYDAWNRLVTALSGSTTVAAYTYNALGRRISETYSGTSTTNYLYYSPQWQVIEERQNGTGTNNVSQQYVWGAAYIDQMISRDTYTSGSISSTLFVLQDANWNVTALTDSSGNVVERYLYDPYGDVTVLNASWVPVSGNVSAFGWRYYHQGGRLDPVTGWYDFRNRDYIPSEGRWSERDPMGFGGGSANIYVYLSDSPGHFNDPYGDCYGPMSPIDLNRYFTRKEMEGLGRWNSDLFWDLMINGSDEQRLQYQNGCIGLAQIRVGIDMETKTYSYPNTRNSAHCFNTFSKAIAYKAKISKKDCGKIKYAIVASQSNMPLSNRFPNPPGEINGNNFRPSLQNHATYHEPEFGNPFWEYMNGAPKNNPEVKVIHSDKLSEEGWATTIYCVVPIGDKSIPPAMKN